MIKEYLIKEFTKPAKIEINGKTYLELNNKTQGILFGQMAFVLLLKSPFLVQNGENVIATVNIIVAFFIYLPLSKINMDKYYNELNNNNRDA